MKVSELIAKLQALPQGSEITEIDTLRLFDDDSAVQDAQQRMDTVNSYLASGDLNGLREFIEAEKETLEKQNPGYIGVPPKGSIEVKVAYPFNFEKFLNVGDEDEVKFILAVASIANEMQFIIFSIDRITKTNDKPVPDAFFYCRLAFFRIYGALGVLESNRKVLEKINPEAREKYIQIRRQFKNDDRSLFKWLQDAAINKVRNTFAHWQLENDAFTQTAQKTYNGRSTIYSYKNKDLNNPQLANNDWVYFGFADDFYSNHFVASVDPNIDLTDTSSEDSVIGEITKDLNEGLGIIGTLCSQIVSDYMQKCFNDFPEQFAIISPTKEPFSINP